MAYRTFTNVYHTTLGHYVVQISAIYDYYRKGTKITKAIR